MSSFSASSVVYTKNPNYYETDKPSIGSVVFNSVDSDTTAELELENGTIDMSYDYITDAAETFVAKNPSQNVYFWPSVSANYLYMNDAKAPFNNVAFRKAVAEDMNTKFIAERAYFGALSAATGGAESAVIGPQVSQWFSPSLKNLEYTYSVKQAQSHLEGGGLQVVKEWPARVERRAKRCRT